MFHDFSDKELGLSYALNASVATGSKIFEGQGYRSWKLELLLESSWPMTLKQVYFSIQFMGHSFLTWLGFGTFEALKTTVVLVSILLLQNYVLEEPPYEH